MKILITSGGTREPIDQVRSITNHASGRLGKTIAETFLNAGHQVTLLTTASAFKPEPHPLLTIITITTVADLKEKIEPLVKSHDALIHSMAVSDYTPIYMTGIEEVAATKDVYRLLDKRNTENKISSADDYQVLFLQKTPKIISHIKEWNPAIMLIGFKLLVGVSKEELFSVARASLQKNQADYILANDLTDITDSQHIAYLVDTKNEIQVQTKTEIAELIFQKVIEKGGH